MQLSMPANRAKYCTSKVQGCVCYNVEICKATFENR